METEKKKQKGGRKMGTKNIRTFYGVPIYIIKTTEDNRLERKSLTKNIEEFLLDVGVSRSDFFCEDTQNMYIVLFLKSYLDTWTEFPEQNHSTLPTKTEFLSIYPQFEGYNTPEYNKRRDEEYEIEKTLAGIVKEEVFDPQLKKTEKQKLIIERNEKIISLWLDGHQQSDIVELITTLGYPTIQQPGVSCIIRSHKARNLYLTK